MLVLSRDDNETIVFPSLGITITPIASRNGKTKLGIEAPQDVKILRGELVDFDDVYEDGLHGPSSD